MPRPNLAAICMCMACDARENRIAEVETDGEFGEKALVDGCVRQPIDRSRQTESHRQDRACFRSASQSTDTEREY